MELKRIEELKEGKCQVLTKSKINGKEKIFAGTYSAEYPAVFFAIPSTYEIVGYYQEDGKMQDYKNDGRGLICLMSICGILAIAILILSFVG
jgi:hypothetical protein